MKLISYTSQYLLYTGQQQNSVDENTKFFWKKNVCFNIYITWLKPKSGVGFILRGWKYYLVLLAANFKELTVDAVEEPTFAVVGSVMRFA